jgi:hypothetical protein
MKEILDQLLQPNKIFSRSEVLERPNPVPRQAGVYAWYFKEVPPRVPTSGCVRVGGLTLLYVGISPGPPPRNGSPPSKQNLRNRIRYLFRGNAEGSTLRLTLGCLLAETLGISLRRVEIGKRITFGEGESILSDRMGKNAFVAWAVTSEPWKAEKLIIRSTSLPLNLGHNEHHPFRQF